MAFCLLCFPMLQYAAFHAVLGYLLSESSCAAARKALDNLYDS